MVSLKALEGPRGLKITGKRDGKCEKMRENDENQEQKKEKRSCSWKCSIFRLLLHPNGFFQAFRVDRLEGYISIFRRCQVNWREPWERPVIPSSCFNMAFPSDCDTSCFKLMFQVARTQPEDREAVTPWLRSCLDGPLGTKLRCLIPRMTSRPAVNLACFAQIYGIGMGPLLGLEEVQLLLALKQRGSREKSHEAWVAKIVGWKKGW